MDSHLLRFFFFFAFLSVSWMGDFGGDWRFITFLHAYFLEIFKYNSQIVMPYGTNLLEFHFHQSLLLLVSRCFYTYYLLIHSTALLSLLRLAQWLQTITWIFLVYLITMYIRTNQRNLKFKKENNAFSFTTTICRVESRHAKIE